MAVPLLFVDTNIYLDFYRHRGRDVALSMLRHIEDNKAQIIMTSQVEMEFQKNRQAVILDSYRGMKLGEGGLEIPGILAESKQSKAIGRSQKEARALTAKLKARLTRVLTHPARNDPVFQTVRRLAQFQSPICLGRAQSKRYSIRRLAWKRFILGYPPRKLADTSIGDAVNWEWIIHCAASAKRDVVIVTRDSDYGVTFDGSTPINDWLSQEFKERVGRTRQITLTGKLSIGLKRIAVRVTRAEEKGESEMVKAGERLARLIDFAPNPATTNLLEHTSGTAGTFLTGGGFGFLPSWGGGGLLDVSD